MNTRVVENYSFPEGEAARLDAIAAALAAGEIPKAIAGAKLEIRLTGAKGTPGATGSLGDAFHGAKLYAVAIELYRTFLAKAQAQDVRRAEVMYRAGVTARRLRMYDLAIGLLRDAARIHEASDRVAAAEKAVKEMEARFAGTPMVAGSNAVSGPCAVIRRASGRIDVSEIGRAVSATCGRPLAEVTRLLHTSPGFVAFDMDPDKALELAGILVQRGVPAMVIPQEKLVALPAPVELSRIEVTREGLALPAKDAPGTAAPRSWRDVFYVSAGVVMVEGKGARAEESMDFTPLPTSPQHVDTFTRAWTLNELRQSKRPAERRVMMDIFLLDPFERYRVAEGSCRFQTPGPDGAAQSHASIERFAAAIAGFGASVPSNEGTTLLALDCPAARWKDMTFDGTDEFDRYNYWRLQLEQYG